MSIREGPYRMITENVNGIIGPAKPGAGKLED
jgi:hypothetical protein